jgi:hypothetical protein
MLLASSNVLEAGPPPHKSGSHFGRAVLRMVIFAQYVFRHSYIRRRRRRADVRRRRENYHSRPSVDVRFLPAISHIASLGAEDASLCAAELKPHPAAGHRQHFVCPRMIMHKIVDAVALRAAPAVSGE